MKSKYRPQLYGWHRDFKKGEQYSSFEKDSLLYANDNYCAFIRHDNLESLINGLFYLFLFFVNSYVIFMFSQLCCELLFANKPIDIYFCLFNVTILLLLIFLMYLFAVPGVCRNLLTFGGSPIIFNRKTGKVYINEGYFFNFKLFYNPLYMFYPLKKRIKEYDWADLQGVVLQFRSSRFSSYMIVLMVCKPDTYKTVDHIIFQPSVLYYGSNCSWGWLNNFMYYEDNLFSFNDGKYKWEQETQFKKEIIEGQGWPDWMVEAFNATTHDELADIKQKYHIKP
ncbi:DUF6708 domain-containing protein [Gilliamella sp. CG16]|uniref:DUF6708 domain-containing protein n=1 Tax=Gilliamella sp. CG16 TaxID=3351503 RepID=UPI003986C56C